MKELISAAKAIEKSESVTEHNIISRFAEAIESDSSIGKRGVALAFDKGLISDEVFEKAKNILRAQGYVVATLEAESSPNEMLIVARW